MGRKRGRRKPWTNLYGAQRQARSQAIMQRKRQNETEEQARERRARAAASMSRLRAERRAERAQIEQEVRKNPEPGTGGSGIATVQQFPSLSLTTAREQLNAAWMSSQLRQHLLLSVPTTSQTLVNASQQEGSGNRTRKRKPDLTFRVAQEDDLKKDGQASDEDTKSEEETGMKAEELKVEKGREDEEKDPFHFLSDADRTLLQTNVVEFLKRFAPKYYIPVYKTWTIPKSTS